VPVEPDQGRPDGEDADDKDWLDDVIWPAETDQGVPWAGAVGPAQAGPAQVGPAAGHGPPRRPGPLVSLIVVAVLAAGTGAGLTFALNGSPGTPAAATSTPSPGRTSGAVPGGGPGGGAGGPVSQMLVIGTVTAVSGTSITIGGNGPPVTAAVTGSTRVAGRVSGIGGIKVGDQVSAQLTQRGGQIVAMAIQYPAQQSAGGIP
jgi:hypothetical protein